MAAEIAAGPGFAHAMTKRMLGIEWAMGVEQAIETEAVAQALCMTTQDFRRAFEAFAARQTTLCKLHMLRLADPGWRLPAPVMSDLGLHRYRGYHGSPSLPALRARLEAEQKPQLDNGVHLIVVQSADGSLVVGDSHHYAATPDPFQPEAVDALILEEFAAVLGAPPPVTERWIGVYPSGPEDAFFEAPMPGVRLVSVTSGTGASTAFGLAEEVLSDLMQMEFPT
jgi:hypothetical protein